MTQPTINQSLKDEYAAHVKEQAEKAKQVDGVSFPVSYEVWLEVTLNAARLDLANAPKAIRAEDSYRAALERVDKELEDLTVTLQNKLRNSKASIKTAKATLQAFLVIEQAYNHIYSIRQYIITALGGVDEDVQS